MNKKIYCEDIKQNFFWCENCGKNTNKLWDSNIIGNNFSTHSYKLNFSGKLNQQSPIFKSKIIWYSICQNCNDSTTWIQMTKNLFTQ